MRLSTLALALFASTMIGSAFADEGTVPLSGVPKLDHVFVIMMENHGYQEVIGNPYMPFLNAEAKSANLATNYFAVAHPSLTNYLEVVGGSNFAVLSDTHPDWHNATCTPTVAGNPNNESSTTNVCPIRGVGMDSPTPLLDLTNETSGPPGIIEIDGIHQYGAAHTVAKTIADQFTAKGLTWKTYQESLPLTGADGIGTSDGFFTDTTVFTAEEQAQGENTGAVLNLYRAEHNPFIYFANVQATAKNGQIPGVVSFEGADGLWADLATGHVPSYSFIAPNRCNDQHAVGGNPFCIHDPNDNGTQVGLNPGLMAVGDIELRKIVTAIKASPLWKHGRTAIVIVWDESDYAISPITNQVVLVVDKNYGPQGVKSATFYTHFSLLKTIEAAFRLPCLNHACDPSTNLMTDLFAGDSDRDFDRD